MIAEFLLDNLVAILLILGYYKYTKLFIIRISPYVARKFIFGRYISTTDMVGSTEIALIAFSHLILAFILLKLFSINIYTLFFKNLSFSLIFLGVLLGLSQLGLSSLINRLFIESLRSLSPKRYPKEIKDWVKMANSGWIRHHLNIIKVLPIYIAIFITITQIGSEETIFRGVLYNHYMQHHSFIYACLLSTFYFSIMQAIHMPSKTSAMFPVVGALVMGISNSILIFIIPNITPLIVGHVVFFIVAII